MVERARKLERRLTYLDQLGDEGGELPKEIDPHSHADPFGFLLIFLTETGFLKKKVPAKSLGNIVARIIFEKDKDPDLNTDAVLAILKCEWKHEHNTEQQCSLLKGTVYAQVIVGAEDASPPQVEVRYNGKILLMAQISGKAKD